MNISGSDFLLKIVKIKIQIFIDRSCYVCTTDSFTLTADVFLIVVEWLQYSALLL